MLTILTSVLLGLPAASIQAEAATGEDRLAVSLEAIAADSIRSDLYFLASDELRGRDTPSHGLRLAARYLRNRLQRLGFQGGGDGGGFFHRYALRNEQLDLGATRLELTVGGDSHTLTFGEDYYFWPNGSASLDVSGELVCVGTATEAEVALLDLEGRMAFALDAQEVPWREREANLRGRGAVGVLVASAPGGTDAHSRTRASGIAGYTARGNLTVLEPGSGPVFPQAYVTAAVAETLLGSGGAPLGRRLGKARDQRALLAGGLIHELENVCGFWPGSDPELRHEVIIVSAHYDHVGVSDGEIYNGADDNGSGTSGLLAIADALATHGPLRRSILLLWVSGEEKGLKGSYAWTKSPSLPRSFRPVCNLNIDMIGRNAPDSLLITPTSDRPEYNRLTRMAETFAASEGFGPLGSADDYWSRSDHANFAQNLGIPVAFLFSDVHEDYHKPTDTPDKIDYDKVRRVSRLVVRMIAALQEDELGM